MPVPWSQFELTELPDTAYFMRMRRQDFAYHLPKALIANEPATERTGSRLLCLDGPSGQVKHRQFPDLLGQLRPGDMMVFNDTKVIPARLLGRKESGGRVEILLERLLDAHRFLAHVRANRAPRPGAHILLQGGPALRVLGRRGTLFELTCASRPVLSLLETAGHIPLPPYIQRKDTPLDKIRYQTVYGRYAGAVAAPTAGLHFDEALLAAIAAKGVEIVYVTLHVGTGTFQPLRVDNIAEHEMHSEWMTISAKACAAIDRARRRRRRVIAVGTTSIRALETVAQHSQGNNLQPYTGETDIFITPGYIFQVVDALVTNFHLPESTLLMLVSAFGGYRHIITAYQRAIERSYRFFSYGDAMFITRNPAAYREVLGS